MTAMTEEIAVEGYTGGRCALPELKRAVSVPATSNLVSVEQLLVSGKPLFKIKLPSLDLSRISHSSRAARTAPAPMLAHSRPFPNQTKHDVPSCADLSALTLDIFRSPSIPLPTPPEDAASNLQDIVLTAKVKSETARNPPCNDHSKTAFPSNGQVSATSTASTSAAVENDHHPRVEEVHESSNTVPPLSAGSSQSDGGTTSWLDQVVDTALLGTSTGRGPEDSIRILSHAIPCPATEVDGTGPSTAFPTLVNAVQNKFFLQPSPYISVIHAIPSSFSMTKLPTSPPGTPSSTVGVEANSHHQEDYFNMNVFNSAVSVINHHDIFNRGAEGIPVSPSPYLAVPPSSIDIALLERWIPPASTQEYLDLFAPAGPSALVNRLLELSPKNGTMIFIHPTQAGASTFTSRYLGPILDPVLRTMINSHGLSADIAIELGRMDVVENLLNFEAMRRKVTFLLGRLSRGASHDYALVHSSKETVNLNRRVWTDWFVQQETPRFRHIITRYFQRAWRLPVQPHVNYAVLTREIIEGLTERKYNVGEEPGSEDGIEVGVFVIRRRS